MLCKRNIVIFKQQSVVTGKHSLNDCPYAPSSSVEMGMKNKIASNRTFVTLWIAWLGLIVSGQVHAQSPDRSFNQSPEPQMDRLWVISTRHLTSVACRAQLESPALRVSKLECRSGCWRSDFSCSLDEYEQTLDSQRQTVIYVHGNRMESSDAIERGLMVYRNIKPFRDGTPIDWVIWSWPSEQQGILARDVRLKAARTDAQGLYLAWLLRRHAERSAETTLIGYSFGGRVVTGSLHALAGGSLAGRSLPGDSVVGMNCRVGLVAPALENDWLNDRGYHRLASQNLDQLQLLYNRRDAVLKRYWLIDQVRGQLALGYTGPTSFAPRLDGTPLPVRSKDCSPIVGLQHDELDYYLKPCRAGCAMATLIDDIDTH